ncbi:MAG: putative Sulfite reductase, contains SirA-like domain (modular protein) [Nitrospira sp.]|nr:putative Sulfite reductase, contains SirA-like domain (modular protein) [Nitrospira sp.]
MSPNSVGLRPAIKTEPIPAHIAEEIETFEAEAERVLGGDLSNDIFKPFRLQYGIYGQRQPGVQMVRIKIPFGGLTGNQLRQVAEIADQFATGVGHVTTRQDIQLHFVELKHVPEIMRLLASVGLTTREACANTVRNVTACHLAGVCQGEVFDVTPYAKTVALHLLRNPLNQSLPRKFKIVGSTPRIAQVLREFTPMDELLPTIEAVIKVFDTLGNRKNRNKARMKFVIEKLGFDEFKRRWEAAYAAMGYAVPTHEPIKLLEYADEPPLLMPTKAPIHTNGNGHSNGGTSFNGNLTAFQAWKRTNVVPQRQAGFATAAIKLPMGDLTGDQMWAVADLAERYSNGNIRTTINQNMVIRWITEGRLEEFYDELVTHSLGDPGAELVEDIIACPGTDTCGLGITSSKGMARALAEVFPAGEVPEDLRDVSVKISGCHNSCAQHHIATIGLHGVGKRLGEHTAPHYELHLGGHVDGTPKIGQLTVKLPAKSVPSAVRHLVDVYRRDRKSGETLQHFIERVGKAALKDELIPYTIVPPYDQDQTYYYDWEGEAEFVLEDLGPGECAGGALEMIDDRMLEADQELYQAKLLVEKHQYALSVNKSYRAVLAAAKALLVTEGIDPATDADTFQEFDQRLANKGSVPAMYQKLGAQVGDLGSKDATAGAANEKMAFAKQFLAVCRAATEQMGKDLKLAPVKEEPVPAAASKVAPAPVAAVQAPVYDLRGVACPMNYVKTKLKLEMMDNGEQLEVWLDAGEPIRNVPVSLRNDGHKILNEGPLEPEAKHFKILVEKVEA